MTIYKTCELTGALLDAAVAKARGIPYQLVPTRYLRESHCVAQCTLNSHVDGFPVFAPSKRWEQGGPFLSSEQIAVQPAAIGDDSHFGFMACIGGWSHGDDCLEGDHIQEGETYLEAAMRSLVASHLGETVELP